MKQLLLIITFTVITVSNLTSQSNDSHDLVIGDLKIEIEQSAEQYSANTNLAVPTFLKYKPELFIRDFKDHINNISKISIESAVNGEKLNHNLNLADFSEKSSSIKSSLFYVNSNEKNHLTDIFLSFNYTVTVILKDNFKITKKFKLSYIDTKEKSLFPDQQQDVIQVSTRNNFLSNLTYHMPPEIFITNVSLDNGYLNLDIYAREDKIGMLEIILRTKDTKGNLWWRSPDFSSPQFLDYFDSIDFSGNKTRHLKIGIKELNQYEKSGSIEESLEKIAYINIVHKGRKDFSDNNLSVLNRGPFYALKSSSPGVFTPVLAPWHNFKNTLLTTENTYLLPTEDLEMQSLIYLSAPLSWVNNYSFENLMPLTESPQAKLSDANALKRSWDISDRDSLLKVLNRALAMDIHDSTYRFLLKIIKTAENFQQAKDLTLKFNTPEEDLKFIWEFRNYDFAQNIASWDLGRGAFLARDGYFLDYITKEECLDWLRRFAQVAKTLYSNWDDYLSSYMLGREYWDSKSKLASSHFSNMLTLQKIYLFRKTIFPYWF